ncbi:MAG TPA: GNAT family N-acetyltransferase [Ktedonobacterales bacterium]|nr:GNAT family N-acetyltransferase [Ktedonobacterales bacterium]
MSMTSDVLLRDLSEDDLPIVFEQQLDTAANYMAAFTASDPVDHDAFMAHWSRILADDAIIKQVIVFDGQVVGNIASFEQQGEREITYWIGRHYWGKGIATSALNAFLRHVTARPLYARAAKDNIASLRVLEKCGFTRVGEGKGYANARGKEVEEWILLLGPNAG